MLELTSPKRLAATLRWCASGISGTSVGIAIAAQIACLATPVNAQQEWTPEAMLGISRVLSVVPSPDGQQAAFVVADARMEGTESEWRSYIYVAATDGSGGTRLTSTEYSSESPSWAPDGARIAFLSDRGDGNQVWTIRVLGGEARQVTKWPESVRDFIWSPSGRQIAFIAREAETPEEQEARREKRDAHVVGAPTRRMIGLYVISALGSVPDVDAWSEPRRLSPSDVTVESWAASRMDWSPDSRQIAFVHQSVPEMNHWPSARISVVDVESGRVLPVRTAGGAAQTPKFSPDGRFLAYTASDDPATWGFTSHVHVLPMDGSEGARPLALTHDEQASILGWRPDGQAVLVSEVHGTVRRVYVLPVDGSPPVALSPPDVMISSPRLSRSGRHLGFVAETPETAPHAWATPSAEFRPVQLSRAQRSVMHPIGAKTEVIRWHSSDGVQVEGLITYPTGYSEGQRVPLLVIIHGGPTGVFTQNFIGTPSQYPVAVFAEQGFAVLRPNPRGSSGYGREFRYANYGDWGGGDYEDILSGVDALVAKGLADPERLGVMGWSYGGYMTSWIVTQTSRFRAASIGAALPNLISFSGTSDVPSFIPDYLGGEFWEMPEKWEAHSPLFQIQGVTTPALIQHGEADVRVPVGQAYELHRALQRQGVESKLVIYPRQPHGIREPKLLLDAMTRNVEWFQQWVLQPDAPAPIP